MVFKLRQHARHIALTLEHGRLEVVHPTKDYGQSREEFTAIVKGKISSGESSLFSCPSGSNETNDLPLSTEREIAMMVTTRLPL